ncbi:MAG TPA: PAS domain-containing sensor histidine kinase [Nitrospirota bacterium]
MSSGIPPEDGIINGPEQDRQASILYSLPDPVMVISRDMTITFANESASRMFGYSPGDRCHPAHNYNSTTCGDCSVTLALREGVVQNSQRRVPLKDGGSRFMDLVATPLMGENGEVKECILVCRDLTAYKEQENRRKDMLAMLSHDLGTPLSLIGLSADQILDNDDGKDAGRTELVNKIKCAASGTHRLLEEFLTYSTLESGRMKLDPVSVPLSLIISYTLDTLSGLIKESGARIEANIPKDLPLLMLDFDTFARVVTNIIVNAVKYGEGGVRILIRAGLDEHDCTRVNLEFTDDGPGIPAGALPHVFDSYYRSRHKCRPEGSGLGLAIVKTIVELHGGKVSINSVEGEGTTVRLLLPAAPGPGFREYAG